MQRVETGGPIYYQFEQWRNQSDFKHGVFTRHGGVSAAPWASLNVGGTVGDDPTAVQRNIDLIFESLDLNPRCFCTVWQVHSADAIVASGGITGRRWLARADGLVTNQRGLTLSMRFADCVPILLYDPAHHAIGIAHAGWRGTVTEVVVSTLRAMQTAYETHPGDVQAAIGPSIGPEHYQVGPEIVDAVLQTYGHTTGLIERAADGSAYLNLWEANRLSLERAGVHQIEIAAISTATNTSDFYSHRAEHGKTGRFCAVISLTE